MQKCTLSGVIHPGTVRVHARYGISVCAAGGAALGAAAALVTALVTALPAAPALLPLLHKVISRDHLSAHDLSASRTSCFAVLHMKAFPARLRLYISQFHQPFSVSIFMSAYTFLLAGKKELLLGERRKDRGPGEQQGFPGAECSSQAGCSCSSCPVQVFAPPQHLIRGYSPAWVQSPSPIAPSSRAQECLVLLGGACPGWQQRLWPLPRWWRLRCSLTSQTSGVGARLGAGTTTRLCGCSRLVCLLVSGAGVTTVPV